MDKIIELWTKFMSIYWTLPFGNSGRGTKVYLFPFVGVAVTLLFAWIVDNYIVM